jgi:molybdopterin-guanine dinucleotide biosynthesis protein A
LDRSAIILAGGVSSRLGQDKGLLTLASKPLIKHVLDAVENIVDEKLVVVSSKVQSERYSRVVREHARVLIDSVKEHGPLVGALTGLEQTSGSYSLILPCDTPLISKDVLTLLLELCINKSAVIPRWPNCCTEPLQAAYCTKPAMNAAREALSVEKFNMQAMVDKLRGIRYISTLVLEQLDPELKTFLNVNTAMDLKKAEGMLKKSGKR